MSAVPTPNGISVTMVYTYNGQRIVNVYNCFRAAPATGANLTALGVIFQAWENSHHKALRHTSSSLVLISMKALDGPGSPVLDVPVSPAIAGTATGSGMPSYATVAVKHTTGLGGRSFKGRTYLCALGSNNVLFPDLVQTFFVTAVNTAFSTLRANLATGGFTFAVASFYHGVDGSGRAIPRATGVLTAITASECGSGLDTQRHRKLPGIV